jgi:hypothetical protein
VRLWDEYVVETGIIERPLSIFDADPAAWVTDKSPA